MEVLGVSVGQADEHWLHQQIAYVLQEPTVFTGTLHENLLMSRPDADSSFVEGVVTALGRSAPTTAIAHHLAWAPQGDQIAVIDQHHMAQYGNHQQLINEEGTDARLWAASQQSV